MTTLLSQPPAQTPEPVDVRRDLVDALRLDLVGPRKGSALENEVLPQAPSRWSYLTGFLVPLEASVQIRSRRFAAKLAAHFRKLTEIGHFRKIE